MSITPVPIQVKVLRVVRRDEPRGQPREELVLRQAEDPPGKDPLLAGVRWAEAVVVDRVAGLTTPASNRAESRTEIGIMLGLLDQGMQLAGCQHPTPPTPTAATREELVPVQETER